MMATKTMVVTMTLYLEAALSPTAMVTSVGRHPGLPTCTSSTPALTPAWDGLHYQRQSTFTPLPL